MIVYWTLFLIPAAMALFEAAKPGHSGTLGLKILLASLLLVAGFRETCGDWLTYNLMYDAISYLPVSGALAYTDPAYGLLNWISYQLNAGIYGVNAAGALIYLSGFYQFAIRERRPILMLAISIAYLFIVVVMGYTRQGIAIGILMWGYTFIYDKMPARYLAIVFLAATFHSTAIVMAPLVYFAFDFQQNKFAATLKLAFATLGVALLAQDYVFRIEALFSNYVDIEHYSSAGAVSRALASAVAAALFFLHWKRWGQRFQDRGLWTIFALAALAAVPLATIESTAVDRMGLYLIPLQLVVFSRLPELQEMRGARDFWIVSTVLIYAASLFVWLHLGQFAAVLWLPYKSLLLGEIA